MKFCCKVLLYILLSSGSVTSFTVQNGGINVSSPSTMVKNNKLVFQRIDYTSSLHKKALYLSSDATQVDNTAEVDNKDTASETTFSASESSFIDSLKNLKDEDWTIVSMIASQPDRSTMDTVLTSTLSTLHPRVIGALRRASDYDMSNDKTADGSSAISSLITTQQLEQLQLVGNALVSILNTSLESSRSLLESFLTCGEIRKLDGAIGKAARDGKLDMSFFTVLNMNLNDAIIEQRNAEAAGAATPTTTTTNEDGSQTFDPSRFQILQHIYTRCQEEVEKTVSPGAGLLNKLLRTEMKSIRTNLYGHYLCPQANTITTPDGKVVELKGESKPLVPPSDFVEAIANAVRQIRTVEKSGGTDRVTAAGLVESCRQIAIEARIAIAENYGADNLVLKAYEEGLQPVFRPESAESEFIKGE